MGGYPVIELNQPFSQYKGRVDFYGKHRSEDIKIA